MLKKQIIRLAGSVLQSQVIGAKTRNFIESHQLTRAFPPKIDKRNELPFQILVYHRVLPAPDPFAIDAITTIDFERQVSALSASFRLITMDQLATELRAGMIGPNSVCITFDDGYRDNFEYAFPILKKYNAPATIFLASNFIGTKERIWHDDVLSALKYATRDRLEFAEAGIADYAIRTDEERSTVAFKLLLWLKQFSHQARDDYVAQLFERCRVKHAESTRLMLNWQEVRFMLKNGFAFGAHTKSHPILSRLSDAEIESEIADSKSAIERAIDVPVSTFAYPNGKAGDFNETCKLALLKAGFTCAVTTLAGANSVSKDPFELHRTAPWDRDPKGFFSRMCFERFAG